MSSPRLSVLMTSYNSARFLPESLESVLSQTFTDFEFIIVDDGSTDKSASIIRSFASCDSRVRGIFLSKNVGIPRAANIGLREVRAALVARVDSDDICAPIRFAKQVSYMDKHADIYMLGCRSISMNEDDDMIEDSGKHKVIFARGRRRIADYIGRGDYPLLHPTLMYRTTRVLALGGYREVFPISEDDDLYERMFVRYGSVFGNLPSVLYFYRRYPTSTSRQYDSKKHHWIKALIRHSSACFRLGLLDPINSVKTIPFPPLSSSKDEFIIMRLVFYLYVYRILLYKSLSPIKNVRRLCMITSKLTRLPKSSKTREFLYRRFFLLLLPAMPSSKDERVDFLKSFDNALFNRDGFLYNKDYSNLCLVVARGCLGFGEWKYFMRYMFISFRIDFIFTLYFIFVRSLAHLRKFYV